MSRQSFGILSKVAEVDDVMTADLQTRVFETHPELIFAALNGPTPAPPRGGRAMRHSKKTSLGRAERLDVLRRYTRIESLATRCPGAAPDDLLDACAALLTANRIWNERAYRYPSAVEIDDRGLRMEMWV